jgi:hypothetical protein
VVVGFSLEINRWPLEQTIQKRPDFLLDLLWIG